MICEKCSVTFEKDYRKHPRGIPRFCSRKCANSRDFSDEAKKLKSSKNKNFYLTHTVKRKISPESRQSMLESLAKGRAVSKQVKKDITLKNIERYLEDGGYESFKSYTFSKNSFKRYILNTRKNVCNVCGLPDVWNGKRLVLQLDHIDGDAMNNKLDNIQLICPNCHSQTDTFCGRNIGKSTREFHIITRN